MAADDARRHEGGRRTGSGAASGAQGSERDFFDYLLGEGKDAGQPPADKGGDDLGLGDLVGGGKDKGGDDLGLGDLTSE